MIDPDFLLTFTAAPFDDYRLPVKHKDAPAVLRIHRPTLSHLVALATLGTPMVPDAIVSNDGWSFEKTLTALALLMTPPEIPQILALVAQENYKEAEKALRFGFGPWTQDTDTAWGNQAIDSFLVSLTGFCHEACQAPALLDTKGKPAATPWPLALLARCIVGGVPTEEAWGLTVAEAFWMAEALSEAKGQGTALVPVSVKIMTAHERAAEAAKKAANQQS